MDIAILGFGAIGQLLYALVAEHLPGVRVTAIVARPGQTNGKPLLPHTQVLHSVDELLALQPALVVECAGHEALRTSGPQVLESGCALLVASVGALADPATETALRRAAQAGDAALRIPAGALGGLDVLGAARFAGLRSVVYTSRKGTRAWRGTAAEDMVDLQGLRTAKVFYQGDARSAALLFPQNANVAAAVALAGAGFDHTLVNLIADPAASGNRHEIAASGDFGEIAISIAGHTLAGNPKTSILAPYSLVRSLANLSSNIVIA